VFCGFVFRGKRRAVPHSRKVGNIKRIAHWKFSRTAKEQQKNREERYRGREKKAKSLGERSA